MTLLAIIFFIITLIVLCVLLVDVFDGIHKKRNLKRKELKNLVWQKVEQIQKLTASPEMRPLSPPIIRDIQTYFSIEEASRITRNFRQASDRLESEKRFYKLITPRADEVLPNNKSMLEGTLSLLDKSIVNMREYLEARNTAIAELNRDYCDYIKSRRGW